MRKIRISAEIEIILCRSCFMPRGVQTLWNIVNWWVPMLSCSLFIY